ncbi:MAG: YfiR family protein [Pseudomonadota bacterium]
MRLPLCVRAWLSTGLAAIGLGLVPVPTAGANDAMVSDLAVKAVLFYKLTQFVYLPGEAGTRALRLCALGTHPITEALRKLGRATDGSRPLAFRAISSPAEAERCEFVFIAGVEAGGLDTVLARLKGGSAVTVSDIPGFARAGGMVEFSENPDKPGVKILINRQAAKRQGIEFNAQLLRLSTLVEP